MCGLTVRLFAVLLAVLLSVGAATGTGVQNSAEPEARSLSTSSSTGVYSLGRSADQADDLNWGSKEDPSVFGGSGDANWLSGVIEGVTQSVVVFSESNSGFLSDGLKLGNVTLDSALFSYGDSVDKTATLFSALDSFAQDVSSIVPINATVPLVLLVLAAIFFFRRNRH